MKIIRDKIEISGNICNLGLAFVRCRCYNIKKYLYAEGVCCPRIADKF